MSDLANECREMARYGNALRQDWTRCLQQAADEIDRLHSALTLAIPVLEVAAQRFSGAKEALEAVKAAMEEKP